MRVLEALPTKPTGRFYLVSDVELRELKETAQEARDALLLGRTWKLKDVVERVGKDSRYIITKVLIPNRTELWDKHCIVRWSTGQGSSYKFRATAMAQWLENNMERIQNGGWD